MHSRMHAPQARGAAGCSPSGRPCLPAHSSLKQYYKHVASYKRRHLSIRAQEAAAVDPSRSEDGSPGYGEGRRTLSGNTWPPKSSIYLFRTDGMSCSRELVTGTGRITFAHPTTQQQLLVWRERPRTAMVIKKLGRELQPQFFDVVRYLGETEGMRVVVEPHEYEEAVAGRQVEGNYLHTFTPRERERLGDVVDFVVCLGGDGVILHAGALFRRALPPVLCFHLGSMGFMTNHGFDDFRRDLRQLIYGVQNLETCGGLLSADSLDGAPGGGGGGNGDGGGNGGGGGGANRLGVMVTLRMRLECSVLRAGESTPEQTYQVLNEVVVDRGSSSFLTNIECYIAGRLITRVQADGVMLATPTGSTAYSVAAGGSMVHPNVPAMLLTPVCPHSLNFRPIVLPDYVELELRVPRNARSGAWVCFDGKARQELLRGDAVLIKMSEHPVPTINKADLTADWFESLERCFRWSDRSEQKPLDGALAGAASGSGDLYEPPPSYGRGSATAAAAVAAAVGPAHAVDPLIGGSSGPDTSNSSSSSSNNHHHHDSSSGGGGSSSSKHTSSSLEDGPAHASRASSSNDSSSSSSGAGNGNGSASSSASASGSSPAGSDLEDGTAYVAGRPVSRLPPPPQKIGGA